jgi:hypothetical protein
MQVKKKIDLLNKNLDLQNIFFNVFIFCCTEAKKYVEYFRMYLQICAFWSAVLLKHSAFSVLFTDISCQENDWNKKKKKKKKKKCTNVNFFGKKKKKTFLSFFLRHWQDSYIAGNNVPPPGRVFVQQEREGGPQRHRSSVSQWDSYVDLHSQRGHPQCLGPYHQLCHGPEQGPTEMQMGKMKLKLAKH